MIKLEGQFFNIDRDLYVNKHWLITGWKTDHTKFYNLELTKKKLIRLFGYLFTEPKAAEFIKFKI